MGFQVAIVLSTPRKSVPSEIIGRRIVLKSEFGGRDAAEAVVGNLVVVVGQPLFGVLTYLGEVSEDMHVEHAAPEAADVPPL